MSNNLSVDFSGFWLWAIQATFLLCKIFEFGPIAAWSWWAVFSPLLIILGLILLLIAITIFVTKKL